MLFDQHSQNAQKALPRGDERSVREIEAHLEAMEGIQMQYLLADPRFLISVFQDRLSKRFRSTDPPEFDRLARNGKQAIEEEDIDTIRETIFRLDQILMTSGSVEKDIGNLSSLMRGSESAP